MTEQNIVPSNSEDFTPVNNLGEAREIDMDVVYDDLMHHQAQHPAEEVCGFIVADPEEDFALEVIPVTNVHEKPEHNFSMDREEEQAVTAKLLAEELKLVAIYHSHQNGSHSLSLEDQSMYLELENVFQRLGGHYLIINEGEVWAWTLADRYDVDMNGELVTTKEYYGTRLA